MDLPPGYPDSPMEQDDAYPCKGCGEILEEGKAFELAGNRWHINCFRCNTCGTLLDSDANLLLLGDGSLICNNCTYSCSACGNKIEDLAILTGDQAFCATCFRCRNCKKKIENLRYARTSQGIFCMECHEGLMARRRKKLGKNSSGRHKLSSNNTMLLDKSLPSLPPNAALHSVFLPDHETPPSDANSDTPTELPAQPVPRRLNNSISENRSAKRERSPAVSDDGPRDNLMLPSTTYKGNRHSGMSRISSNGEDFIPMALDLQTVPGLSPMARHHHFDSPDAATKSQSAETRVNSRDYFNVKAPPVSTHKSSHDYEKSQGSPHQSSIPGSQPSSPHIAYQEKGREPSSDILGTIRKRNEQGRSSSVNNLAAFDKVDEPPKATQPEGKKFRLQEVPKRKKSGTSNRNSRVEFPSTLLDTTITDPKSKSAPVSASTQVKEQQITVSKSSPNSAPSTETFSDSPHTPQDSKSHDNGSRPTPTSNSPPSTQLQHVPLRGDSLQKIASKQPVISRKEVAASKPTDNVTQAESTRDHPSSAPAQIGNRQESSTTSANLNGGRQNSVESPSPRSNIDILQPPARAKERPLYSESTNDPYTPPRTGSHLQNETHYRVRNTSVSTLQSVSTRNGDQPASPTLPRYSAGVDFSMDEDMARILGNDDMEQASFLRRVSNSVRHARSYSDRGTRLSKEPKWPKSPLNDTLTTGFPRETSSPAASSPETREEVAWLKNEIQRERQKNMEKNQKIAELEATLEGRTAIKEMNNELREKRSTMVVLDTQKELVVRELEILTEHIAASKKSSDPLDLSQMSNIVLREFGESLEKLKESFAPQIMDLTQKRNDVAEEVANFSQLREHALQEFENLSLKNAQLAELNNSLVHQIQAIHKADAESRSDTVKTQPHGLGIYTHHSKEKSSVSMDSRELRPSITDSSFAGSTVVQDQESEPATILTTPQVVNLRKGQPKKFNWKKGGQNVAKGVTKGLKGAFTSNDAHKYQREGSITEGIPYGAMPQSHEYPTTTLQRGPANDPTRQQFGLFNNQKPKPSPSRGMPNGNPPAVACEHPSVLYGSELEQRAEYEKVLIPGIVTRCIEEVELRGMDAEGIYRKSGGNSQILYIKEGFEHDNAFDISDPDLDINAVTSALKQYFRKLPTPLITYPVYDMLLDSTTVTDDQYRIALMRSAIDELPSRHKDCLEFLVFHLARIVTQESKNLMTSLNIAVVFAPTIMRPESITREMSDTQAKNQSVQFLIENCQSVFQVES